MADNNVIEAIKTLRERTGAGMMDCKHALEANGFDIEKSIDWLREKGIAKAAQRAGRVAAEGLTLVKVCDKCGKGAVIEMNCETDFVSASDKFKALVDGAMKIVLKNEPKDIEEARKLAKQVLDDTALAVGEKLDFRRFAILHKTPEQGFGTYIHMGGKISVLCVLAKNDPEFANQIAMHIAANNPLYLALADVPSAERERERAIAQAEVAADPKLAGKPDEIKSQIVERKVDKTLSASCLLLQNYLLDETKTVGDILKARDNQVVAYVRFQVGEGIAKDCAQCR